MPRMKWDKLNQRQLGQYGEYYAKMEFASYGYDVYTSEVDDHGVDFVARDIVTGTFYEVQVIILSDENVKKLVEYRNTQEVLWTKYKERNNLEMMYLVQWSILEKLVKVITIEYRRDILKKSMKSWLAHLDNGQEKPDRTPNF